MRIVLCVCVFATSAATSAKVHATIPLLNEHSVTFDAMIELPKEKCCNVKRYTHIVRDFIEVSASRYLYMVHLHPTALYCCISCVFFFRHDAAQKTDEFHA